MTFFETVPTIGLPRDLDGWEQRGGLVVPHRKRPVGVDLFCGCGGFSLGFMQAGFEVGAALDNDPHAALTYMLNLGSYPIEIHYATPEDKERLNKAVQDGTKRKGSNVVTGMRSGTGWIAHHPEHPPVHHFFFGDVRRFSGADILRALGVRRGDVDCVFGGPPCQGFSRAGKREVMDPRNSLVFEFARLIIEMLPKSMVMENVTGIVDMLTPEGLPVIDTLCRVLEDGGFGGVDALRASLGATSGAGAALRHKPMEKQRSKARTKAEPDTAAAQVSLFDLAAPGGDVR